MRHQISNNTIFNFKCNPNVLHMFTWLTFNNYYIKYSTIGDLFMKIRNIQKKITWNKVTALMRHEISNNTIFNFRCNPNVLHMFTWLTFNNYNIKYSTIGAIYMENSLRC